MTSRRAGSVLAAPLLVFLVALGSAFGAFFWSPNPVASPASDGRTPADLMPLAQDDSLASWNPHVECGAVRATIPYLLGTAYPNQQATGAPYHTNGTSGEGKAKGGIPSKRALSPPCSITNISGQALTAFVQVEGVYLPSYGVQTIECAKN